MKKTQKAHSWHLVYPFGATVKTFSLAFYDLLSVYWNWNYICVCIKGFNHLNIFHNIKTLICVRSRIKWVE